jgi:hypothetical protein
MPYKDKVKQLEAVRKRLKYNVAVARGWVSTYFSLHPCVDCGESHPATLDFDHVRGEKFANVSVLIRRGQTLKVIQREVEKCDVRCSNCHRKRTSKLNGWRTSGPVV